jgi:hypothetical protein
LAIFGPGSVRSGRHQRRGSNEWWDSEDAPAASPLALGEAWQRERGSPTFQRQPRQPYTAVASPNGVAASNSKFGDLANGGQFSVGVIPEYRHSVGENFS